MELVSRNMPIDKFGDVRVHHYLATGNNGKWNENQRWNKMDLKFPCTIWYVGANTHGRDGLRLQQEYPCHIHIFEPVPSFMSALRKNWKGVPRSTLHNFGLGKTSRTVRDVPVRGESTFAMDTKHKNGKNLKTPSGQETINIRAVQGVYDELGKAHIDLLHMNCEGCEWEVMDALIASGIASRIRIIQIGFHYFPSIPNPKQQYCAISDGLSRSHTIDFRQIFAWERWLLVPEKASLNSPE